MATPRSKAATVTFSPRKCPKQMGMCAASGHCRRTPEQAFRMFIIGPKEAEAPRNHPASIEITEVWRAGAMGFWRRPQTDAPEEAAERAHAVGNLASRP